MNGVIDRLNDWSDPLFNGVILPLSGILGMVLDTVFFFVYLLPPWVGVIFVAVISALISCFLERIMGRSRTGKLARLYSERMQQVGAAGRPALSAGTALLRKGTRDAADEAYNDLVMHQFYLLGVTWFLPMVTVLVWLDQVVFLPERLETLTGSAFVLPGLEMGAPAFYLTVFHLALVVFRLSAFIVKRGARS
ncbi:hypothetical protein JCM14469_37340 [Desulfatiferula olefinivorans]